MNGLSLCFFLYKCVDESAKIILWNGGLPDEYIGASPNSEIAPITVFRRQPVVH